MLLGELVLHVLIRGGGALVRLLLRLRLGQRLRLGIESLRCSHLGFVAGVESTAAMLFCIAALAEHISRPCLRKRAWLGALLLGCG